MTNESVEVDAERFEELCRHYSGDILGKNFCKPVAFANRLWTITGTVSGGNQVPTAQLHELVLPDQFEGPTGSYPFDSDGVFYKGQVVKARGRTFVMSGRTLLVARKDGAPASQLDLLDWHEDGAESIERRKPKAQKNVNKVTERPLAAKKKESARSKQRAKSARKIKRR